MSVEDQRENNGYRTGGCTGRGFRPGTSGNRGDRPRGQSLRALVRDRLEEDSGGERTRAERTRAERIVDALLGAAEAGDMPAIRELLDRLLAKATQRVELDAASRMMVEIHPSGLSSENCRSLHALAERAGGLSWGGKAYEGESPLTLWEPSESGSTTSPEP